MGIVHLTGVSRNMEEGGEMERLAEILKAAILMEEKGRTMYARLAEDACDSLMSSVLTSLSNDESAHEIAIRGYLRAVSGGEAMQFEVSRRELREREAGMADTLKVVDGLRVNDIGVLELYRAAWEFEKRTRDFYAHQAHDADDRDAAEFFRFLCRIENAHAAALESVISASERDG
ncbi:MAG: hypothetical protein KBC96_08025 [Armatimonadetes bacterium]|nr:hypothetical protein [Armatimonadota bacterium]